MTKVMIENMVSLLLGTQTIQTLCVSARQSAENKGSIGYRGYKGIARYFIDSR